MTCKNCGNKYYTSVCPCVLNQSYIKPTPKKGYLFKALMLTLGVITLIMIIGSGIYDIYRLNNILVEKNKKITDLKSNNEYLKSKINRDKRLISQLSRQNNELRKKKNRYTSTNKTRSYTKPKTYKRKTSTYTKPKQYTRQQNTYTKPKTYNRAVQNTTTKKYQKFSKNIKLVSDSRITMKSDNRLASTMPIYGRYYKKDILNIKCDNNDRLYKVVNECKIKLLYGFDNIYSSKSNLKKIKSLNKNTHMIECSYNKEHGLMQDCKTKLIGIM